MTNNGTKLIESDEFPFEFLSQVGERESWRKEIHRPIYHVHKWWAKRLGSIFRGILLGSALPRTADLERAFYLENEFGDASVFDPFMGSGTTIGEAHKLGFAALGRDINPVAYKATKVAFGPIGRAQLDQAFAELSSNVGKRLRLLYKSTDGAGAPCDVLYYFWVMQAECPSCKDAVDLFSSYVFARNAYPSRKPVTRVVCPACGDVFRGTHGQTDTQCPHCRHRFNAECGPARGAQSKCRTCSHEFAIQRAILASGARPRFRQYAKLVLMANGEKEYLRATSEDERAFRECSLALAKAKRTGEFKTANLKLEDGYNTRQAIGYNFREWADFFNDRQLLALGWLREAIEEIADDGARAWLNTLFSGVLEFNNLFASYKGEGTGAVRHMFAHHILKPERTPIEANVWGTAKSSGAFSTLYRTRLLRALEYREHPSEVAGSNARPTVCSQPFSGRVEPWPTSRNFSRRAIYLSCGDSATSGLPDRCVDLVVTDPPFFDNVHYSELADFFHAWDFNRSGTTRKPEEVQDGDACRFAEKLAAVFRECRRVLKDNGLLVFTYHHSRDEGWKAVADALGESRFTVVNCHPVKSEMSVATPKAAAKDPIQLDVILVCRKNEASLLPAVSADEARASADRKIQRLEKAGFTLSRNDRRVVQAGQLMTVTIWESSDEGKAAGRSSVSDERNDEVRLPHN